MRDRIRWDLVAGTVVLVDVLRVYLPSLITVFGQAGGTPAEYMGGYAVSWFVLAFAAVWLVRLVSAVRLALIAGAVLCLARLGLQFTDGGDPQLYISTVGLVAGLVWLVANAMRSHDSRSAAVSVMAGLAAATTIHAALDGVDLVWRDGILAWAAVLAELAWYAVALWRSRNHTGDPGTARWWLCLGPALLLWGMYAGNPFYTGASNGWPGWVASVVVTATAVASVSVTARPQLLSRHRWVPASALMVSTAAFAVAPMTVDGIAGVLPNWAFAIAVVGQLGLAGCLGWAVAVREPRSGQDAVLESEIGGDASIGASGSATRRGLAVATGMLGFIVLLFAFYAAYDLYLPNRWVPVAAAAAVTAVGIAAGARTPSRWTLPARRLATVTAVAALAAGVAPLWQTVLPAGRPPADGFRVAAYNVRMGFGESGTLSVDSQAKALAALDAHVIVLSEVDRGWLLNGGHDDLRRIATRLGMTYVWAPATDELWGDALLTDLPITSVRNHPLVHGGPTGAQALEVGIDWGGEDVTVIATHTQPPPDWEPLDQVEQLASIAADAAADGTPVVLAGDLNMEPDEPAFAVLRDAGLVDSFAQVRPVNTIPGPAVQQIDHILTTPDFTATDPANPDLGYSDHRPIAVTLQLS